MRTCFAVLVCFCLSVGLVRAQQENTSTNTTEGNGGNKKEIAVAKPGIIVTDINFGYRPIHLDALIANPFRIVNRGLANLTITKNSGVVPSSAATVFDISEVKSQKYPIVLGDINSGSNELRLRVKFTPNKVGPFDATITFSSNGAGIDSVCRLHGIGIEPGIAVNACDFGRRRIFGTYDSDQEGGPAQLTVINSLGGQTSTVNSYSISGDKTEFEVDDLSDLKGMVMNPAQEIIRSIKFKPTKPGYDTLRITFTVSTGSPIVFVATGIGVTPHLLLNDLDFGQANLADTSKATVTKTFSITNLDVTTTPKWEFWDNILLDDCGAAAGATTIGSGGKATPGTEGFSFSKAQFDLPYFIGAGLTSIDFNAWYHPSTVGKNKAVFSIHDSDYDTTYTMNWTGEAISDASPVQEDQAHFSVTPNPVRDLLRLGFNTAEERSISLRDALGRQLEQQHCTEQQCSLQLSNYSSGVYFIEIRDASGRSVQRIVKE